jgi:hypothetical protein
MITLSIDPEFKTLIPKLTDSEYGHLEKSIRMEGCRQPIIHWHGVIVDGHNRYEICRRLGIDYQTEEKSFESREEVISWICLNQLSRRNITDETRRYLIGKRYEAEKIICSQRNAHGINQYSKLRLEGLSKKGFDYASSRTGVVRRTSQLIGSEYNLGHTTVEHYGQYSRMVDEIGRKEPSIVPRLLSGELHLSFDKTLRLSQMNRPNVEMLKQQAAYPDSFSSGSTDESTNLLYGKNKKAPKLNPGQITLHTSVKTKPTFDPDAEINGLTMTIPAWMNSITRVKESTALDQVSVGAREKLVNALKELQCVVVNILQKVGA